MSFSILDEVSVNVSNYITHQLGIFHILCNVQKSGKTCKAFQIYVIFVIHQKGIHLEAISTVCAGSAGALC